LGANQHPRRNLHKTPLFWWSLAIPVFTGFILAGLILWRNWNILCFTFEVSCVNQFLPTYKLPLGVASLGLVMAALVGQMHRSGQTVSTLEMTDANNRFSNRFKHEEEFLKFAETISIEVPASIEGMRPFTLQLKKSHELYITFFPRNQWEMINYEVNQADLITVLTGYFKRLELELQKVDMENCQSNEETKRIFDMFTLLFKTDVKTYELSFEAGNVDKKVPVTYVSFEDLYFLHRAALAAYRLAVGFMGQRDTIDMIPQFLCESVSPSLIKLSKLAREHRVLRNEGVHLD